jgi:DNA-binding GntR family transcriptional regulator
MTTRINPARKSRARTNGLHDPAGKDKEGRRQRTPGNAGKSGRVKKTAASKSRKKATWQNATGDFGIPRVARETLNDRVYIELKRSILNGSIMPGARISMRSLSKSIGTSLMPVREAMRRLSAEGALEILPNRSFTLPILTPDTFRQMRDVRVALEGMATEAAATNLSHAEFNELERLNAQMEGAVEMALADYLDLHERFHFAIYAASRSEVLLLILKSLWLQIRPLLNQIMVAKRYEICSDYHGSALQALKRRDGKAARAAIEADILDAAETILKLMQEDQQPKRRKTATG